MIKARHYSAKDALQPLPPVTWLVDGLIVDGSVGVFYGEPGSKKTWALLDLAVCVAAGTPWLDNLATLKGPVLVVDEESGAQRLLRRLGEVIRGHLADDSLLLFAYSLAGFNLWGPGGDLVALDLQNAIKSFGARLVIFDALADIMLGGDENAVKDTQPVFRRLRGISEATGTAILVIHHAGKNGGYRGSSAIKGAPDLVVQVTSKPNSVGVEFETIKFRDGEPIKLTGECHWAPNQFWMTGGPTTAAQAQIPAHIFTSGEKYVLRYLSGQPGLRAAKPDIEANADTCSVSAAQKAIYSLTSLGILNKVSTHGTGSAAVYELDPIGLAQHPNHP